MSIKQTVRWISGGVIGSMALLACGPPADPDPIACPEGATPQFMRFDEARIGFDPDVLSAVGWRCQLPSGERHGPSKEWFRNGQVSAITEWWQGEKHGRFEMWHSNGQKRAEGEHSHWQAVGVWRTWDTDGKLLQEKDFGPPREAPAADTPTGVEGTEGAPASAPADAGSGESGETSDVPAEMGATPAADAQPGAAERP